MAFVLGYGKGRVFHCVLGHDVRALSGEGVQTLYRRGTAWAAGLPPMANRDVPKQEPIPKPGARARTPA
jgi:type 1 glutamine amidotransferase